MLSRSPRIAAVARTHDTRRKNAAPFRAASLGAHILGASRIFFVLGISAMLSLFARADVRSLVNDGKVTWTGGPTVIYLNADGTPATAAAYDHLVLKFTDTTAAGSLTVDDSVRANAHILVVGGGGAGGNASGATQNFGAGGGGGAGGFIDTTQGLVGGTYTINVGTGGVVTAENHGGNGGSSSFKSNDLTIEALGGGGGGSGGNGSAGASGGGGSQEFDTAGRKVITHTGGGATPGQGNAGGNGNYGFSAGGGGGAGAAGGDSRASNSGGIGGAGLASSILLDSEGHEIYYAGGGGSGTRNRATDAEQLGQGGVGGGGNGGGSSSAVAGTNGLGGGGGGGSANNTAGAAGGSGVVIVRITQLVETQVALPSVGPFTFNKSNQVALDFGIAYTYVSGDTNATDVGKYSFVVTPGPDLAWDAAAGGGTGEKTINWSITKRLLSKPTAATGLTYDGTDQVGVTYADADLLEYCTFDASSVTNATNGGTYTYSVSLNDKVNTTWNDSTTDDVNGSWTIAPQKVAVPTPKTDLVYDGNEKQGFDSLDYTRYELTAGATNATAGGAHPFTFSLLGNDGAVNYAWDTDPVSSEPYSGEWIIAAAANSVTKPVLEGWRLGTTPNVPTATALYGEVNYAYVFGEDLGNVADWVYDTSAINTDGVWTVIAMVDATDNWIGATNSSQFAMWDDPVKLFRDHVDIKVTPPAGSSETFINFAALVKISEDRFYGFEYARAGSDGNKLMFLDSNRNTLPFDVDTWRTTGESLVWVLIPELPPAGTTITMYWNLKEGRTPPPNNPEEVWPLYSGVWHMNESITSTQAATALSYDSTTNKNDATPTKGGNGNLNQMVSREGRIGNARVNSTSTSVAQGNRLQTARTQTFNGVFTFSGWFWMNARGNYPRFGGTKAGAAGSTHGWSVETKQNSSTLLYVRGDGASTWDDNGKGIPVDDMLNNWVYLTFVYNNTSAAIYSNGKHSKTASITKVVDSTQPLSFGAHGTGDEWSLNGAYDEIRITGQALSAQRIAAEYATVVSNDFTVQGSAVSRDDVKRNYWVSLPAMDKTDWDVTETPGAITNAGQLAFCGVTNYIYSVYDPTRTFASTADLTEVGYYRIVFLPDDSEGYEPISHTIEIHVVEGQPYSGIVGNNGDSGRILLMNNHTWSKTSVTNVDYQGWFDADNAGANNGTTSTYWHHENLSTPSASGFNLKDGTESVLHAVDGRRLWHIVNCRHGNTFPMDPTTNLEPLQNYLSWNTTYSRNIGDHSINRRTGLQTVANRSTVGQVVMQNIEDATVYSSCFTNGIGTIYFDAVNGWKPLSDEERGYYNLVVEIATNTVEGLLPTDINCVTYTVETDPDTEEVTSIITNWYGNLENCWHAVPVIPYKRDGTANFEKGVKTEELALDVENGGTMNNFFRVVVPLDIAGPVRFRIRRTTRAPDSVYQVDEAGFILLDNIIASVPAMSADLVSAGHYDEEKSGSQTLGWELATSVPYPSVGDTTNIVVYAKPEFTLNVGDGSTPDTNTFFSSATMHYRWRYLNQTLGQPVSAWKDIALNPSDNFKAIGPLDLPNRPGDVEYWFDYRLQAPYYKYVDYSGASNASIDYTEERGVLTNKLADASIASGGSDWYFRIREGQSDYAGLDIVFRRGASAALERVHMALVDNHVWRGFVQTKENQKGTMLYHIEGLDRQTAEFADYAATTNYWRCRVDDPRFPVSESLESSTADSWSTLTIDAVTGYVMFQIDDSSMALTVVHADYQNANGWSDALGRSDSLGRGPIFVGTSTTNAYKIGVSPTKQTFGDDFSGWGDMAATNALWTFVTGLTDIKPNHMLGRKTYETFASDTNGLWEVGQGQWIAKKYRDDRDNAGVALQMEGYGKGYLQFSDAAKAPRGLESISFNARLTQYIRFEDFAYYFGGDENILNLQNYTFVARTAFDLNSNKDFKGNASLSVVANYLPNKGCYEARWEWLGNNATAQRGQRLCLYRWNVTSSGTKEPELIIARTNTTFHVEELTALANSSSQRFAPLFISVSNDVPNKCTYVVAGIRRCGVALGTSPIGTTALNTSNGRNANWFGVCFKDTDQAKRLAKGSYGVLSANCPGVFACPEFSHTTQVTVGQFPNNGKLRDSFDSSSLSQVSNLKNVKNCAYDDLQDSEYPGWNIIPGRDYVSYTAPDVNAVIGSAPAQELLLYLGTAGRRDWGSTPYKRITVDGFGGATETVPLYTTKDCSVRFALGSASSDVAIDSVEFRQWRGGDWNGDDVKAEKIAPSWASAGSGEQSPIYTNFVFTSCWTKNNDILMSAKRANLVTPSAIRAPLMDGVANNGYGGDGYCRGIGLGMISVGYKDAQPNASLLLQIATNRVSYMSADTYDRSFSDSVWTTITNYNFATMTEAQRQSGVLNTYLGLHSVTGMMRIVVNTNAINAVASIMDTTRFGDVTITSISCSDEPPVDVHSWWGWNMRTVGGDKDSERMMLLDDFSTAPGGAGLSLALNNSVDADYASSRIDVADRESYRQHKPFVQTPTFTSNIVGEVVFKARKYASTDPHATISVYGSRNASENDDGTWEPISGAVFMVTNDWYETYSCKMDPRYKAFRLAVAGVDDIKDDDKDGGGNVLPDGAYDPPPRVLIDEIFVSEAVNAIMGFKNVGCFRSNLAETTEQPNVPSASEQPICEEQWGVQCEIYGAQLAADIDFSRPPTVYLHWYEGIYPWGFENWQNDKNAHSAQLSRATGTDEDRFVYRSSMRTSPAAVIPMSLTAPTYVQYTLQVVFYTKENPLVASTNWLSASDWKIPEWYRPLDLNAENGKGGSFAAYNIIDNVAPGWAWINEVNVFGLFENWHNTDEDCQFVEIAHPPEADMSGWTVRLLEPSVGNNLVITNVLARFGSGGLAGRKQISPEDASCNMVFRVIASEATRRGGRLKVDNGTLDAVWNVDNPTLEFSSDGVISHYDPMVYQLVRTSGIVEHEIMLEGTNYLETLEIEGPDYLYNMRDFVTNKVANSIIILPGYDYGGASNSLSVIKNFGHNGMEEPENDWTHAVKMTPGHHNIGQVIDPNHPVPSGEEVLVYLTVAGDHILQSQDGVNFTNGMFTTVVSKGNPVGTNVIYRVDPWYVLGSVTTGNVSIIDQATMIKATQPFEYNLAHVAKGISNNVTVVASAALNPRFSAEWGVPEDDPYRDAIIAWLEGGTDLYGNSFAKIDEGEIQLAKFRALSGTIVTNLTLREMYWLDMDPTIGNLSLIGGMKDAPMGVPREMTLGEGESSIVLTNRRMTVYMMISNENDVVTAPVHPRGIHDFTTHWTPYVLRGLEPGEESSEYVSSTGKWNSVTFKIVGLLLNGYTSFDNLDNKVPLRHFVFNPNSFDADGLSRIEIYDPYSSLSFGYNAGWSRWWDEQREKGEPLSSVVFFWTIDTRQPPLGTEQLKETNYYGE